MGSLGLHRYVIGDLIKELPNVLEKGEIIKKWVVGSVKGILGGSGLLVATNKGLIFIAQKLIGLQVESLPYEKITSIQFRKGIFRGEIKVFAPESHWVLEDVDNDSGIEFSEYVDRAHISVEKLKDTRDFEGLISALESEDRDVRRNAVKVLGELGDVAVEPLIQTVRCNDGEVRKTAAEALGKIGNWGVVILRGGLIKFANSMTTKINGFPKSELVEKLFTKFIAPDFEELVLERYKKRLSGQRVPSRYEIEIISKSGVRIPVELNAFLVEYEGAPADLVLIRDLRKPQRKNKKEPHPMSAKPLEAMMSPQCEIKIKPKN
jgi:PAS domain S-box-containing protein